MAKRGRKPLSETEEMIEYAKTHTRKDWAEHFSSTIGYANCFYYNHRILKRVKRDAQKGINVKEFIEYAKTHYTSEIERHFNICANTLRSMAKKYNVKIYYKTEIKKINKPVSDNIQEKKTSFCSVCVSNACANCCHNYTSKFRV